MRITKFIVPMLSKINELFVLIKYSGRLVILIAEI